VRVAARRPQRLGIALVLPVVLLVPYLLLSGSIRNGVVVWLTVGVVLLIAAGRVHRLLGGPLPRPTWTGDRMWQGAGTLSGIVGLALLLTLGLDVDDVAVFAAVVAVLLVVAVHAFSGWQRWALAVGTVALWGVLLLRAGVTDPAVLSLHAAGALLLAVGTARMADGLALGTAAAAAERRRAEQQAVVLAEVLRARSLDPAEVQRAVLRGLDAVGFEVSAIRRVDAFAGRAVLVAHRNHLPVEMEVDSRTDLGLLGVAIGERREVVVDDVSTDPLAIDRGEGFRGGIVVPLLDHGEVFATVEAVVCSGPLDALQVAAARQLAAAAERALVRARSFAADRRLVRERDRLQERTERFVAERAGRVAEPVRSLRAEARLLRLRADELDDEQRAAAVRRIDEHGRQLTALVRSLVDDADAARSSLDVDVQPVALRALVDAVLAWDPPGWEGSDVVVEVSPGLVVEVDPTLVQRLIAELVAAVAAHGPAPRVLVGARRVGDRVRVTVRGTAAPAMSVGTAPVAATVVSAAAPLRTAAALSVTGSVADGAQEEQLSLAIAQQIARAHGSELLVQRPLGRPATAACTLRIAG
jgi:signal transduction histidine kinase